MIFDSPNWYPFSIRLFLRLELVITDYKLKLKICSAGCKNKNSLYNKKIIRIVLLHLEYWTILIKLNLTQTLTNGNFKFEFNWIGSSKFFSKFVGKRLYVFTIKIFILGVDGIALIHLQWSFLSISVAWIIE